MFTLVLIELYLVAGTAIYFAIIKLVKAYASYRYKEKTAREALNKLPTISVCLPARNETNSMSECLERVLASDYPKMEVIVLDDDSSDNTSYIIKAFAHAGVRFVQGSERPDDWLGKNYSLEALLDEASGDYVVFMDVDTRIEPQTIRLMVERAIEGRRAMISVIPQRHDTYRPSAWLATMRYFWEIVLDSKQSPGSSSAIWLADRKLLKDNLGGFSRWRDEVQPERYIASEMAKVEAYQLIISTPSLGVSFVKKWSSQIETGRRLLLPRFNNSIGNSVLGIGLLFAVILPPSIALWSIIMGGSIELWPSAGISVLILIAFVLYCGLVWRSRSWIGALVAPYVVWQEMFLLISSILGYKFGTITWKGRPVNRPKRKLVESE